MQAYLWWLILAAVLVGVELASGTFYLLVYGVAAAAGVAAGHPRGQRQHAGCGQSRGASPRPATP